MILDGNAVWVTSGPYVVKYIRGKEVSCFLTYCILSYSSAFQTIRLENPLATPLSYLSVLGSQILALTEDGRRMFVWDSKSGGKFSVKFLFIAANALHADLENTIQFEPGFTATSLLHPATYLNKVLVGSSEGKMQLWNIRTQ